MSDDKMKILAHHQWNMGNQVVPIFQQAVIKDLELFTETWAQITAGVYMLGGAIVWLDTLLGNI